MPEIHMARSRSRSHRIRQTLPGVSIEILSCMELIAVQTLLLQCLRNLVLYSLKTNFKYTSLEPRSYWSFSFFPLFRHPSRSCESRARVSECSTLIASRAMHRAQVGRLMRGTGTLRYCCKPCQRYDAASKFRLLRDWSLDVVSWVWFPQSFHFLLSKTILNLGDGNQLLDLHDLSSSTRSHGLKDSLHALAKTQRS